MVGLRSAALAWKFSTGGAVLSCPAIGLDGRILFGSADGYLYAVSSEGRLLWKFSTQSAIVSSPRVLRDGTTFCACTDGKRNTA